MLKKITNSGKVINVVLLTMIYARKAKLHKILKLLNVILYWYL